MTWHSADWNYFFGVFLGFYMGPPSLLQTHTGTAVASGNFCLFQLKAWLLLFLYSIYILSYCDLKNVHLLWAETWYVARIVLYLLGCFCCNIFCIWFHIVAGSNSLLSPCSVLKLETKRHPRWYSTQVFFFIVLTQVK